MMTFHSGIFFRNYVIILYVHTFFYILLKGTSPFLSCSNSYNKKSPQISRFSDKHWGEVAPASSMHTLHGRRGIHLIADIMRV